MTTKHQVWCWIKAGPRRISCSGGKVINSQRPCWFSEVFSPWCLVWTTQRVLAWMTKGLYTNWLWPQSPSPSSLTSLFTSCWNGCAKIRGVCLCYNPSEGHLYTGQSAIILSPSPPSSLAPFPIQHYTKSQHITTPGLWLCSFLCLGWLWSMGRNLLLIQGKP